MSMFDTRRPPHIQRGFGRYSCLLVGLPSAAITVGEFLVSVDSPSLPNMLKTLAIGAVAAGSLWGEHKLQGPGA